MGTGIYDVVVIGGGIIGLSIARELAGRKSVLLLDRGATGQGTSRAAAGMLSPLSEADDQDPFFDLCRAGLAMYDQFIQELKEESGLDVGYSTEGLLFLASSEDSAATLRRRYEWQRKSRFNVELLGGQQSVAVELEKGGGVLAVIAAAESSPQVGPGLLCEAAEPGV